MSFFTVVSIFERIFLKTRFTRLFRFFPVGFRFSVFCRNRLTLPACLNSLINSGYIGPDIQYACVCLIKKEREREVFVNRLNIYNNVFCLLKSINYTHCFVCFTF